MNRSSIDRVANAALYEGYILYPYRPAVKNRQRWTFGGLYPEDYCRSVGGSESSSAHTECLVRGDRSTCVEAALRFLHLTQRQVSRFNPPLAPGSPFAATPDQPVESLRVEGRIYHTWQEAEERAVASDDFLIGTLLEEPALTPFSFSARHWDEALTAADGTIAGALHRDQQALWGVVEIAAELLAHGLFKLSVTIHNQTPASPGGRDDALMQSLVSAHLMLGVCGGEFVSLVDPPESCRAAVAACRNRGLWPVLVGETGRHDAMLAAPIILYDYPQIAPESPGDLFDSTEIDEILMLRIMTLTEEEKELAAAVDERARALLSRVESMPETELAGLHGTIRGKRLTATGIVHG